MKQERITKSAREIDIEKKWFVVDAKDQIVGRFASNVARILRGKHKPVFTPHVDSGDFVVIINAEKVRLTGKRETQKTYFRHSMYPGGGKTTSFREYMQKNPAYILEHAIKGMIPKTRLGNRISKKLKVYAGESHPHSAQKPEVLKF